MGNLRAVVLVATLAAGAAGGACGGGSGSGLGIYNGLVSCTTSDPAGGSMPLQICQEITGATAAQAEQEVQGCNGTLGSPDAGAANLHADYEPCSRVNALGGCKVVQGTLTVTSWYYDDGGGLTSADVQTLCTSVGATFVAP